MGLAKAREVRFLESVRWLGEKACASLAFAGGPRGIVVRLVIATRLALVGPSRAA